MRASRGPLSSTDSPPVSPQERNRFILHCCIVLRHFLEIEHFHAAFTDTVSLWLKEIREHRELMFLQLRNSPSLLSECASLFHDAWDVARLDACLELAGLDVEYELRPDFDSAFLIHEYLVPSDCPYRMEHVTGFDLEPFDPDKQPSYSTFPHQVSLVISEKFGRSHGLSH